MTVVTEHTDGRAYREAIERLLAEEWRFGGLHATGGGVVRALFVDRAGATRLESLRETHVPTIVDLAPAAGWDEREAHDAHGVRFDGHEPLRPLLAHADGWITPVAGVDPYEVAVGPVHAGVIESGHFRFHVVGDRILHVDARLFYKHRGLERAAEGHALADAIVFPGRACAGCAVANTVAYAQACEALLGVGGDREVSRARTILLELERVWNTFNDIGAICAGVGLAAGTSRFLALTEEARALDERLTGHRFLFGTVAVGGSPLSLDRTAVAHARDELARLRDESTRAWRELLFNGSFMDRMPGIGVVTPETANALGAVGPAARAAGVPEDARTQSPALAYDAFEPASLRRMAGDVQSRLEQRALELLPTFDLLDRLLDRPLRPVSLPRTETPVAIGVGRVESPRGATSCAVERDGNRVGRLRLRTGSYANWPVLARAAVGELLPDFPLVNKSFELCYACVDR